MREKYNVNFDQTFYANFLYISKILEIADIYDYKTKEEISELTGIPTGKISGKVEPHILYSKYMNLINVQKNQKGYKLLKTELGKLIYEEDLYFMEDITKIICHYFLTSSLIGAELWYKIVREFPTMLGNEVDENIVINELENYYGSKVKLTAFKGCYTNTNSFSNLNIVNINNGVIKFREFHFKDEDIYALAFTLLKELEYLDSNRKEFTVNEVFNKLYWHKAFGWNENYAMDVLEKLEKKGVLGFNRQLLPATIVVKQSSKELLPKLYSLLV